MLSIKSKAMKTLAGLAVVATMALGASTAFATSMTLPGTGVISNKSLHSVVKAAQEDLNEALGSLITPLVVDGFYGAKTTAAARVFQTNHGGLTVDGLIGPKTQAALMAAGGGSMSGNFPAGCTSASGFSATTGLACNSVMANTFAPAGCTSASGFSPVTGGACYATSSNQSSTGPLTVALASDNPAAGYIIGGQATADLAHFAFSGTGTLNSVTLARTGISDQNTLTNVYLYNGVTRLTDGYSFNNAGQIVFNNLGIMINGSMVISVKADVASVVNASTLGVTLTSYTAGTTVSSANVMGNQMYYGVGNLASATLSANTVSASTVNPGTTAYTVWSAPIQVSTRSIYLKSANFRVIGSAPANALQNAHLYKDGLQVGTVGAMTTIGGTQYIAFDLSSAPVALTTGSHTLDVRADVVNGSSLTVQVSLQQAADLMLFDQQVGVNIAVSSFTANSAGIITIASGSISASIDPTFASTASTITSGASNVTIAKYKLHAYGEDVKVMDVVITPTLVTATTLSNITLYFNGSQVGSSYTCTTAGADPGCGHAHTFSLGSAMIVPAGVDSYLEVHADMNDINGAALATGSTISIAGDIPSIDTQGMSSKGTVSDTPLSAITALTAQTGSIAIGTNNTMGTTTVSPNMTHVRIGSFVVANQSSSEGVHVTNLKVGVALTTSGATNYSNLVTSENAVGTSAPQPINLATATAGNTSWNNFSVDFTIAPGTQHIVDIFADTGASTSASVVTKLFVTGLGASSNVTICSPTTTGGSVNGCNNGRTDGVTNPASGQTANISTPTFNNGGAVVSAPTTTPQYIATAVSTTYPNGGATDATVATFNFKSTNGSTTITELNFNVTSKNADTTVTSVRVGTATANVFSGIAHLQGLNITVPTGGSGVNVNAYMTYAPVGTNQAGTSGDDSFVELTYVKYTAGSTTSTLVGGSTSTGAVNTDPSTYTAIAPVGDLSGTFPVLNTNETITFAHAAEVSQLQPGMRVYIYVPGDSSASKDTLAIVQSIDSTTTATIKGLNIGSNATTASDALRFYSIPQTPSYASSADNCSTQVEGAVTVVAGGTSKTDCFILVGSSPSITMNTGGTLQSTSTIIGSVTVAADAHGDIAINTLPISQTVSGNVTVANGTVVVKNHADGSTITTTENSPGTLDAADARTTTITFTGGYTVQAGHSVTFDIYETPANTSGSNADSMSSSVTSALTWTDIAGSGTTGGQTGALINLTTGLNNGVSYIHD